MKIELASSYKLFKPGQLAGQTAIMVDALRASATMITALNNGCDRIIPVESTERAMEVYRHQIGELLLGGESEGIKIQDFDLGNSPLEYKSIFVAEKVLIYCTTNGTRALRSMMEAGNVYIGTLINASAVAKRVSEFEKVDIVCAGHHGRLSAEDFFASGCIIDRLMQLNVSIETDDAAHLALLAYRNYHSEPEKLLAGTQHYEELLQLGFNEDIAYCLQEDICNVIPEYKEGIIRGS